MSAMPIQLIAPGTVLTASAGPLAQTEIPTLSQVHLMVKCTAVSGAGATLTMWLVESPDGGANWFDIPFNQKMPSSAAAANPSVAIDLRNAVDGQTAAFSSIAVYQTMPAVLIGLMTVLSGTTPNFTLGAWLVGK